MIRSLPFKLSLLSFVLTLIGVMSMTLIAYHYCDEILQKKALTSLAQKVEREGAVLSQLITTIQEDARFLSNSPAIKGMARSLANDGFDEQENMTLALWKERLQDQFTTVLKQRNMYHQLRIIGVANDGREMIRVARLGSQVEVVGDAYLQTKGHRPYFLAGIALQRDAMYISKISLNREHGEITYPLSPMFRVVIALRYSNGDVFGILVVNAEIKKMASGLRQLPKGITYFMANDQGDYVVHPDAHRVMSFEYDRAHRLQDDYPRLATAFSSMVAGKGVDESQSFTLSHQGVGLSLYHFHFDPAHLERFLIIGAVEKLSSLRQQSLQLRNILLFIMVVLTVLLAMLTFFMVRGITRPISQLTEAANKIRAGYDAVDIPVEGNDEIASLGISFREMLVHLKASQKALQQSNSMLEQQVKERTYELQTAKEHLETQNIELKNALEQASVAANSKNQFLAAMSHEIRTPLNAVLGLTELVLDSTLTTLQREHLETVFDSGETLLTILNDILDLSKIEAGKFELHYHPFSPNDLVEYIAKLYGHAAYQKGIEFIVGSIPVLTHLVLGDANRLRQILMNLLSNAIKFTDDGEVFFHIEALHEDKQTIKLHFSVKDTGIGIAADQQSLLFDDFSQIDSSDTRKYGGTGLGLSIAQKLVQLMGSEIRMESEVAKGSHFWFDLVLNKGSALAHTAKDHPPAFNQWRILIVDDNQTNREVLEHTISKWGMRNSSVGSGQAALQSLMAEADGAQPYHLALIDYKMPEMDGLVLASRIQDEEKLSTLKVIMLSSLDDGIDNDQKEAYGLDAFLHKPVHHSALYPLMLSVMGVKERNSDAPLPKMSLTRNVKILLAEDVFFNQQVVLGVLKKLGIENVDVANNGVEALQQFSTGKYALVLLDIQMPEMDGYMLTQKIRAIEGTEKTAARTPIIALTAHAFAHEKDKSIAIGMDDLITKPLTTAKLASVINRWLPDETKSIAAKTLDHHVLKQLHADMGEGIGAIIDIYLSELPKQIDAIGKAIDADDADVLSSLSHRLKGASYNIGALALAKLCERLKDGGDQALLLLLRHEADAVMNAFEKDWVKVLR